MKTKGLYLLVIMTCILVFIGCRNESRKIQNIESFARLYGYVRWFHPSDESAAINWDKFAVMGVKKVEQVKSNKELKDSLLSLFSPIVQGLKIATRKIDIPIEADALTPSNISDSKIIAWQHLGVWLGEKSNIYTSSRTHKTDIPEGELYQAKNAVKAESAGKLFERTPRFGEYIQEQIGNNLYCSLPLALYEVNGATYPVSDSNALNRLKREISNIKLTSAFDRQINLACVVIAWNVLQHFYPYFDVVKCNWDEILPQTLKKTLSNQSKADFTVSLNEMVAKLEDGHGVAYGEQMYHLPIRTEFIENNIVITASEDFRMQPGDIIRQINGIKVEKALMEMENQVSGSPQLKRHRSLNVLGSSYQSEITKLVFERNGKNMSSDVQNKKGIKNMFFNRIIDLKCKDYDIKEWETGIFYLNLSNCTSGLIGDRIGDLANAKAVIYDYRWGSQGGLFQLIPHMTKDSLNSALWNIPQVIYPDRKEMTFHQSRWAIQPELPFFESKRIIITAPCVVSSGETEMGIIDHYNLAETVGESTAGCNGNVNWILLPNGYQIMWTGMKVLKHDSSQHHLIGFQPDYPVERTLAGVKEGRDEVLEKALEIARNTIK